MADGRARTLPLLAPALVLAAALSLAACSSDPPDPAEVRRGQVRDRLEATFSDAQASCILDALDDATIRALVRTTDLPADDERFTQYSNVVLLCTRDAAAAATTTGSGSFLKRHSTATVNSASAAVVTSLIERWPMTTTAPVIAPMAAAVTPSTKATMPGRLPCFLKYGAGRMVKK